MREYIIPLLDMNFTLFESSYKFTPYYYIMYIAIESLLCFTDKSNSFHNLDKRFYRKYNAEI